MKKILYATIGFLAVLFVVIALTPEKHTPENSQAIYNDADKILFLTDSGNLAWYYKDSDTYHILKKALVIELREEQWHVAD